MCYILNPRGKIMDLHILDGQTARTTTATAINTAQIAGNTAETARNTALIAESNERIAYSNEQILLHLLDTKCLAEYGMTSIEIEKEYYKYTDAIVSIIKEIVRKRRNLYIYSNRTHNLTLKDKIFGFFSPKYKENAEKNIFFLKQEDKEKIKQLKSELANIDVDIQQINELLPVYNEWRTKISRMNIPTYRTYREHRKQYFTGKELSSYANDVLFNGYSEHYHFYRHFTY